MVLKVICFQLSCRSCSSVQVLLEDNIDLAWLQGHLLQDLQAIESLAEAGMHPDDAQRILQLRAHDKSGRASVRVNLTGDATFWLNDLEKDSVYRSAST
jgi:hypothetical protein